LKFILLDRDGVINRRIVDGYVTSWDRFVFLPRALDGLRLLADHGYAALIVSNQAAAGKGLMNPAELDAITHRFLGEVQKEGGRIEGVYYCLHRPEDGCDCRKPKPGLLRRAQEEHGFSFKETFLLGDAESDLVAANSVGCPAIMISEDGEHFTNRLLRPLAILPSLYAAAEFVIARQATLRS
jgi:histidinol-phosphate phosphatase family protein